MLQLETDEKNLRKQIQFAIKNLHGIRVGLFTPDQAFDVVTREQIRKLKVGVCCVFNW